MPPQPRLTTPFSFCPSSCRWGQHTAVSVATWSQTYVGDILLATNPYESLPIYGSDVGELYKGGRSKDDLPPHVYALADRAYEAMLNTKMDQCFVRSQAAGTAA